MKFYGHWYYTDTSHGPSHYDQFVIFIFQNLKDDADDKIIETSLNSDVQHCKQRVHVYCHFGSNINV